jgi:quercetin dioxygenase-like cupin family protein
MTRRDLTLMSAAFLAATAKAQKPNVTLPSKTYRFEDLVLKGNGRAVFDGMTHTGFHVSLHETQLAPGAMPHPPHRHDHEEVIMIREGTIEVNNEGNISTVGPGGAIYNASNDLHSMKNIGDTMANYFVVEFGHKV